ncbi:uncharacterized protein N7477_000361 [Penicillium maclennaniae]|uniref:uncharacterized protein n=1 Tax=Penicillium maclennaniae TaxID=1343394 RepID=UPI00253F8DAC|nr:uncharacterized protein N7477_000361 [Penicillium maclennaniae]KAJ5684016.1 hypothetical protein N7477_000361 [Penicillium maclennaniae]
MRILDPQSAVLTNVEVLAYLNANPPHRVPPRPQHFRGPWVPSPDLRDHNTVVKEVSHLQIPFRRFPGAIIARLESSSPAYESSIDDELHKLRDCNSKAHNSQIHNYVSRISPHLLKYPRHAPRPSSSQSQSQAAMTGTMRPGAGDGEPDPSLLPEVPSNELTPMDYALRDIITKLQPYGLTKAEVVMILNLGLGLTSTTDTEGHPNGDGEMEVDEGHTNGVEGEEGGG